MTFELNNNSSFSNFDRENIFSKYNLGVTNLKCYEEYKATLFFVKIWILRISPADTDEIQSPFHSHLTFFKENVYWVIT